MSVNRDLIKTIMECSAMQLNALNKVGGTIFHRTIAFTDIPLEELKILQKRGADFNAVDDYGVSILSYAIVRKRSIDCIKNLIKLGADPDEADPEGYTSLFLAVEAGNFELASFIVSEDVDVNAMDYFGDAPLHKVFALKTGSAQMAELLLENGADVHAIGGLGYTPAELMVHLEYVDFELMQVLKEYGADFNCTEDDEDNSLLYAAVSIKRSMDLIRNLVELGADPKLANNKGQNPLFAAVAAEYVEAAEYLISVGCDVNTADKTGKTPLHFVLLTTGCTAPITKLLLSKGAKVNAKDWRGSTPVHYAGLPEKGPSDFFEVLEILKEYGADFNSVDNKGISPLSRCIFEGRNPTLLQKLVDLGADLEFVHEKQNSMTLLHLAAVNFDLNTINWLLSVGADINKTDSNGDTALDYAFDRIKEILKKHGTDVSSVDSGDNLPRRLSIYEVNDIALLQKLVDLVATWKTVHKKPNNMTLLHLACSKLDLDAVNWFLSFGADIIALPYR